MTPGSPDEALHFRGKTLTPESPRPVHIAEPANIPVLQNQMDPVFNDTSTYEIPENVAHGHTPQTQDGRMPRGQYAGSDGGGGVRGNQGPVQSQEQQQQRQQPYPPAAGSFFLFRPTSLLVDGLMDQHDSTSTIIQPYPSIPIPTMTETSVVQDPTAPPSSTATIIAANSSLTACPPPDTATLLAQAIPNGPPHAPPQGIPVANEINNPSADWSAQPASSHDHHRLEFQNKKPEDNASHPEDGVDFQNLLDNLPPPSTAAPSAPTVSETAPSADDPSLNPQPAATADESLKSSSGLPPRPPPQEKPSIHPNYNPSDNIRSYHQLPPSHSNTSPTQPAQQSNYPSQLGLPSLVAAGAPGTASGASSLPPPPGPSFQQTPPSGTESQEAANNKNGRLDRQAGRQTKSGDDDAPWGPEVQKKYDDFLHNERIYVTEGLWDRFPPGSRLFVGNLPTERVTKRDLFHIFHKYGKLAQISIKQAYGFIQFLESPACKQALDAEQGAVVRGRKIHLEISKPQRNTRPAPATAEPPRAAPPRRSRSPEFTRNGPTGRTPRPPGDRYDRGYEPPGRLPFSDFRDEPTHRRRDDYRPPPRSPSPRVFRGRDGYRSRDRTPERYDRRRRSRSPYARDRRYRTPSPRGRSAYDSDSDLPVPRRAPRDVPEVQILVLEEVDRNFIFLVETAFRNRGLRVDVLVLGARIPLNAAVQRQIMEGVLAVVRLSRPNQYSRKIPVQVFDRSGGPDNVRFNEYPEVEPNIAAEIVFHAQSMHRGGPPVPFPPNPAFGVPPLAPAPIPQAPLPALSNPPNVASMISSLDGPTLQSLLSALQQQRQPPIPATQQPFPVANAPHAAADLASLLTNATRQPVAPNAQQPLPSLPPQPFPLQGPSTPVVPDPNLISLLTKGLGGQQPQNQGAVGPHVQNIMNQLTKWKQ
ncbi:hypothetical protein ASPWEDRAFT_49159 [Aspergillus wentii DTO 134E9]|uniref:RRM domain-containing protein n=1 Tax=Aspergillus wentii DTO 134E9 TaxID=1073089 RepID=A0A1L9RVZ0_ASPWE|nr:uncharacterized protein ASPWEDRAFT_49159 [Aspergillus wentii DTO 134E9]OJJ39095.1 hypothetical protein ASPWEDRAFT_49159 [Aspergillus wentii DTO 134E9]